MTLSKQPNKSEVSTQRPRGRGIYRPRCPFWGPLAAISNFEGSGALQAVSECLWCRMAGIVSLLLLLLLHHHLSHIPKDRRFYRLSQIGVQ